MEVLGAVSIPIWLTLSFIFFTAFYWYWTQNYGIWAKQGIPELRPTLLFGGLLKGLIKLPQDLQIEKYRKYGRLYGEFEGSRPVLSVADPDLIKTILVKEFHIFDARSDLKMGYPIFDHMVALSSGKDWKRVRSIISPTFTSGKLKRMAHLARDLVQLTLHNLLEEAERGKDVDIRKHYYRLVLATIARCAFGTKLKNLKDEHHPFIVNTKKVISALSFRKLLLYRFLPQVRWFGMKQLPLGPFLYYRDIVRSIIQQRQQQKVKDSDFIQTIIDLLQGTSDETQDDVTEMSHYDVGSGSSRTRLLTTGETWWKELLESTMCLEKEEFS